MSTTIDPQAKAVMDRHAIMVRERTEWDSVWQELKDLVRPDTTDFGGGGGRSIEARRKIFDGTAPWALEQLARRPALLPDFPG
jgi:hypothetical protein